MKASGKSAILMYHSIDSSGSVISINPAIFARQMEWLASSGIPVVPLSGILQNSGSVALTFDDGFRNFYTDALPVLERHRLPSTLFVVTGRCGLDNAWAGQNPNVPVLPLMNWDEVRESAVRGVTIGAHTVMHPDLRLCSREDALTEIRQSKEDLELRLDRDAGSFAYPYGRSTPLLRQEVRALFPIGCGTALRFVDPANDVSNLPRIDAYYLKNKRVFETLMDTRGRLYLGLRELLRGLRECRFR